MSCLHSIRAAAQEELRSEQFRRAVDAEKIRLLQRKSFWSRIFPFTIIINRKTS